MTSATYRPAINRHQASPRRRAASFALALAIEVLLLLAFFTINFREREKPQFEGGRLTTFDVSADSDRDSSKAVQKPQEVTPVKPRPRPELPAIKPEVKLPERPLQMIELSREEYLASDIAKLGSNAPGAAAQLAQGSAAGDSERVGTAPNGQPLYAAEWYREPTNRELAAYLPKSMPDGGGWGLVACRTAERFRVEDCVELGNSPPGSHLAGAVRQAAWQFLVRPPRVGGKSLVGEWVRIRIDYRTAERSGGFAQPR